MNKSLKQILVVFLFQMFCLAAFALQVKEGEHQIKVFSNREGFFQNSINDICRDLSGDLWFATVNGLIRYDGYKFYDYNSTGESNSIQNNLTHSLLVDREGHIWISNSGGLCVYDSNIEVFHQIHCEKNESHFSESPDGNIWVASDKNIAIYHPENISHVQMSISLRDYFNETIRTIHVVSETQCIISTTDRIIQVDVETEENYKVTVLEPMGFDLAGIRSVTVEDYFLWIGTNSSFLQCTIDKGKLMVVRDFPLQEIIGTELPVAIRSIFIDSDDKIWLGTRLNGVIEFDRPSNTFYTYRKLVNKGLSSPTINCFFEDEFASLWIGTAQGGVNQIDMTEKPFYSYPHEPYNKASLSGNLVNSILQDDEGYIWSSFVNFTISKSKAPLTSVNNIEFTQVEDKNNVFAKMDVLHMFQDDKGWMWMSDVKSSYLYDEKNKEFFPLKLSLKSKPYLAMRTRSITQLDDETFMFVGDGIVLVKNPWQKMLRGERIELTSSATLGDGVSVEDLVKDDYGNYWVATLMGLKTFRINGETIELTDIPERYQGEDKELLTTSMLTIHKSEGVLWVGTFGKGLVSLSLGENGEIQTLRHFNESDGLPDDMVYGILEDEEKNLWVSTDMGIARLSKDVKKIDIFDINDGLLYNNFRRYAYLKTKSNAFILGGLKGLIVFRPEDIVKAQLPPKVKISQIRVDNIVVNPQTLIDGEQLLEKTVSQTNKLTLFPKNKSLNVDVITQHNATPHKNKVEYMLEGVDNDWITIDEGKATVNYTNLRPGNYVFRYRGTNGDGLSTEKDGLLHIQVKPPWYLRWWSIVLFVLFVFGATWGVMSYYLRMRKLQQDLVFERTDKERLHEIDEAKLRLFTNISHEFKTPLSLIMAPLEKVIENNKNDENNKYISIIQSNIQRLQRLIEQLITYRKNETGKLKVHYSEVTLGDFVFPLFEAFEENMASKNVKFTHKVDQPDTKVVIDAEKTELVIFNLLSNAVKYTKSGGQITFNSSFDSDMDGMVTFTVTDDGIGILPENISKVFDRFYRSERSGSQSGGFGIGLAFSKSLVDGMQGVIKVKSEPNSFTSFEVSLPYLNEPDAIVQKTSEESFAKLPMPIETVISKTPIDKSSPTILVIDDEIDFRIFLQHTLSGEYNVILAENGEEGLEKLNMMSPQLVICDVMMEGLSGFEVCEKIKTNTDTCHIPVILLTALSAEENEFKSVELGANYYMQKPFSVKLLEVKVKQLISDRRSLQDHFSKKSYLPEEEMGIPVRERKFLEKINEAIEKNMSDSAFGPAELAADVGYSISHFSRRLKQLTGQVPNLYLRNYRLQAAAEMLSRDKDINTKEVMYDVGIESPSYFSAAFKKLYGVAPSVYRDSIQDKEELEA